MSVTVALRDFIVQELRWNGQDGALTEVYPLLDNNVLDSLGIFQVVAFLEERYGVEIADQDLVPENFENLAAIDRLVTSRAVG